MWICYSHIFFCYISVLMVEIEKKYKIYEKNFGYINWLGFFTLYKKEIFRFLKVAIQTIISPLVTALLFLVVLSLAIGNERGGALGFPFITFLAPGLIAMQIIQQMHFFSSTSRVGLPLTCAGRIAATGQRATTDGRSQTFATRSWLIFGGLVC